MVAFPGESDRNPLAADCRRCPALVECRERIAWGNGPLDAEIVVVGEAPGTGDPTADRWRGGNWTGMAYTSQHSGRRIRRLMASVGVEDAYFTNAVKCLPGDGNGGTREPATTEQANCRPYLREEIETVAPRVVLPTGRHATTSIFALVDRELDGFLDVVLEPVRATGLDGTIVPLLHPSYQDVWLRRLGYDPDGYREAIADALVSV